MAQRSGGADKATFGKNQVTPVMGLWAEILGPMACLNEGPGVDGGGGREEFP